MRNEITFHPVTHEHIVECADFMRPEDEAEFIAASGGWDNYRSIEYCVLNSRLAETVMCDGHVLAIYGVGFSKRGHTVGCPWMASTYHVERYWVPFARASRPKIREFLQGYEYLSNYVDTRHQKAVKWLQWCGFEMKEIEMMSGVPFYRFEMRRDQCAS